MMTNENHADDLQQATSLSDLLEDGGELLGDESDAVVDPAQAEDGGEQAADDGQVEEPKPEIKKLGDDVLKKTRDTLSRVRNDQVQSYRILKSLEEDGVYSREEMAEKAGMGVGEVNRLLDNKPTAAQGEPEYQQVLYNAFEQDVKSPVVMNVLAKAYGGRDKLEELKQAYIWAHRVDPSVQDLLNEVLPEDMTTHVFDTGAEYLEEYREAQAAGKTPLQMLREARASKAQKPNEKTDGEAKAEPEARPSKKVEQSMPTLANRMPKPQTTSPQEEWMKRLSS